MTAATVVRAHAAHRLGLPVRVFDYRRVWIVSDNLLVPAQKLGAVTRKEAHQLCGYGVLLCTSVVALAWKDYDGR